MSGRTQSPPSQSEDSAIERPDPRLALRRRLRLSDKCSAESIAEAQRQTLAIAQSPQEREDLDFIKAVSVLRRDS